MMRIKCLPYLRFLFLVLTKLYMDYTIFVYFLHKKIPLTVHREWYRCNKNPPYGLHIMYINNAYFVKAKFYRRK